MHLATQPTLLPEHADEHAMSRALSRATYNDTTHCWLISRVDVRGYPYPVLRSGKQIRPHRLMLEYFDAPAPPDTVADWLCGNRACVNPDHLRWIPAVPVAQRRVVTPHPKPRNAPRTPTPLTDPVIADERRRHRQRQRQYKARAAPRAAAAEAQRLAELRDVL